MNVFKKITSTVLSAAMSVTAFAAPLAQMAETVSARTVDVSTVQNFEYKDYGIGSGWSTHQYRVDMGDGANHWAYCVAPNDHRPDSGKFDIEPQDRNTTLGEVLFWADFDMSRFKVPKEIEAKNYWSKHHTSYKPGKKWCLTHLAASYAKGSKESELKQHANGDSVDTAKEIVSYCKKQGAIPNYEYSVKSDYGKFKSESAKPTKYAVKADTKLSVVPALAECSWNGNNTVTKEFVVTCNDTQDVKFTLPSDVRMIYINVGKTAVHEVAAGGKATLQNGDRFWFVSTGPNKEYKGHTVKLTGKTKSFNVYYLKNRKGNDQDLAFLDTDDEKLYIKPSFNTDSTPNKYTLSAKKVDADTGQELQGATFGVYWDYACTDKVDSFTSGGYKTISENEMAPHNYIVYVREDAAPDGYQFDSRPQQVQFDAGSDEDQTAAPLTFYDRKKIKIRVYKKVDEYNPTPEIKYGANLPSNPSNFSSHPEASATWTKTSENQKPLAGATIGLYQGENLLFSGDTDNNGTYTFEDASLNPGDYTVKEIAPPATYKENHESYPVHIDNNSYNANEHAFYAEATIPDTPVLIHTTATDGENGSHYSMADDDVTIVDQVAYQGLEVGKEYTLTGTLMDKTTKNNVQNDGKDVTGSTTFKPDKESGVVYVDFKLKGSDLANHDVVAYETLTGPTYDKTGKESKGEVASHKDINDEGQTIHFPAIHTTTTDSDTGDNRSYADDEVTVLDKIVYQNIDPDKTYQIEGTLMDKKSGKPISADGTVAEESKTEEKSDESKAETKTDAKSEESQTESKTDTKSEDASTETKTDAKSEESKTDSKTETKSEDTTNAVKATSVVYYVKASDSEKSESDYIVSEDGSSVRKVEKGKGTYIEKQPDAKNPLAFNSKAIGGGKDGVVYAKFTFPGKHLVGKTAVVFEDLKDEKYTYATHADLKDEAQTQYFPEIHTLAVDADSKTNLTSPDRDMNITDTVYYKNLKKGDTYKVEGYLIDKATGDKIKDDDGKVVYSIKEFKAEDSEGTVDVPFHFKGTNLKEGMTMVVYETLFKDRPEAETKDKTETKTEDSTETKSEDSTETKSEDSTEQKSEDKTETKTEDSKTTSVDASEIVPDESKIIYATHKDKDDEKETIYVPNIKTKVTDKTTGTNTTHIGKALEIIDTVTYKNLLPGKTYTMQGTLMDKKTGAVIKDASGNEVTAKTEFTPDKSEGTVDVVFKFDGSNLVGGYTMVAFEKLMYGENDYAVHEDIADESQSEYVPEIHTTANGTSGTPMIMAGKKTKIIDTVAYANLCPGTPYVLKGTLMNKESGKPMKTKKGKAIVAEATFTPSEATGTTNVTFEFDGTDMEGKTGVVFEKAFVVNPTTGEQVPVAEHEDLTDIPQTIFLPKIHTKATIGDEKSATVKSNTKIKDTVSYSNVVAGEQYLIKGTLMDKKTKKAIKDNGEKVTAEATFTPTDTSGEQEVTFKFDSRKLGGHDAVVYEKLYVVKNGKNHKIAVHENIKDKSQTVHLKPKKGIPKSTTPSGKVQTGDTMKMAIYLVIAIVAVGGVATILIRRKKDK